LVISAATLPMQVLSLRCFPRTKQPMVINADH
jgi:hypothetical protein